LSPTVTELLTLPHLRHGELLAGRDAADRRPTSWISVIHWPAAAFARPGDLVLTTGVGCPEAELPSFVADIAASGAAALCVSVPPGGGAEPARAAIAEAERCGLPLIALPWEVAFADVMREVIDRLIEERYAASLDGPERLHERFAAALLEAAGLNGLASALEACVAGDVLVFDADFRAAAAGPRALESLGELGLGALRRRADELSAAELDALRALLEFGGPRRVEGLECLRIGPGTGLAAVARRRPVAYVYVAEPTGALARPVMPSLEVRALEQAAVAVAIEMLRDSALAEGAAQARDDFVWEILDGTLRDAEEIARRGRPAGFDARARYEVAVVRGARDAAAPERAAQALLTRASRSGRRIVVCSREGVTVVVLAHGSGSERELARLVRAVSGEHPDVTWGLADAPRPLADLRDAYGEAERALRVGRSIATSDSVADARELSAYMMLGALGDDAYAAAQAGVIVAPLTEYDRDTGRNLVETLEIYLEESGNTSSAARRLFLNRHSLLYRLRKIEALTGRSLDRPADRFLLDLSLKLHRFGALDVDSPRYAAVDA
jgi:purine catabolism regulator